MKMEKNDWWRTNLLRRMKFDLSVANQLHNAYQINDMFETFILGLFEEYYPEIYKNGFDFSFDVDSYDNSVEIYFKCEMPEFPWEPNQAIRKEILGLGFDTIYWNFVNDPDQKYHEEIRGDEKRRFKNRGN